MRKYLFFVVSSAIILLALHTGAHAAAAAGGGAYPWDNGLTSLKQDLTGPTAAALGLLGAFCALAALIWGGELNGVVRSLVIVVFIVSSLTGITALITSFGITGAVVAAAPSHGVYTDALSMPWLSAL